MKDFLERSLKIVSDLNGYGDCFKYAALYEGHKTIVLQLGYLIELLEKTLPELREMKDYMEAKNK